MAMDSISRSFYFIFIGCAVFHRLVPNCGTYDLSSLAFPSVPTSKLPQSLSQPEPLHPILPIIDLSSRMGLISEIQKIPPVTRYLCLATAGATGATELRMLDPHWLLYYTYYVFQKREVWRIYSSFLVGKSNLSFVFDMMMLYKALNHLETESYDRRSSDLAYQLMWVAPAIVATSSLPTPFPQKALILAIVYLRSRLFPNKMTSIMGYQVPMKYQPYILIAFDLLTSGRREAMLGVTGSVVGYIWWQTVWGGDSSGQGALSTRAKAPEWLRKWMGEHQSE